MKSMKKRLRGFTFIEVILYIGLFSLLGTALLTFAWDILKLSHEGNTERLVTEGGRFVVERMKYSMRQAAGVDTETSVFESADGRLVLDQFGSSNTLTFELQNGKVVMQESGQDAIVLQPQNTQTTALLFERSSSPDQSVEYMTVTLTLETLLQAPLEYASSTTFETGVVIRNLGL